MKTSFTADDLKLRIATLQARSLQQEDDLKYTAGLLVESLKPANLIRETFKSTVQSPGFGKSLLKGAAGLAVGFLTKRLFVSSSSGIVKKAVGTMLELGIAKIVTKNATKIAGSGIKILNKIVK
jgi:hypothetical protein